MSGLHDHISSMERDGITPPTVLGGPLAPQRKGLSSKDLIQQMVKDFGADLQAEAHGVRWSWVPVTLVLLVPMGTADSSVSGHAEKGMLANSLMSPVVK